MVKVTGDLPREEGVGGGGGSLHFLAELAEEQGSKTEYDLVWGLAGDKI